MWIVLVLALLAPRPVGAGHGGQEEDPPPAAERVRRRADEVPQDVFVRGTAPVVRIDRRTIVSSLVFARELTTPCTVTSRSFDLAPGARIVYEKSAGVANQSVVAELVLHGDASIVNDNGWTHMAHMLRFEGRFVGAGLLTVDGAGDGGVLLAGDSLTSFTGPIQVVGGNLIVGHPGALGTTEAPTTLRAGRLSLHGGDTAEDLVFAGDAALHTGVNVSLRGNVTVAEEATAHLDTGGGNTGSLLGRLEGAGNFVFRGGGRNPALALAPFTLGGAEANTLNGRITVARGTLALGKPPGVAAVAGELHLGGGSNLAAIRLDADEQIADTTGLVTSGDHPALLWSNGHTETLGPLTLGTDGIVRMGQGADVVHFAASKDATWAEGCELIVEGWAGAKRGGGEDRLVFGTSRRSLTPTQTAAIGFRDPAGLGPGLYTARLEAKGEVLPNRRVKPHPGNAFPIGQKDDAGRAALYEIDGLASLCGPESPLEAQATISFFGDSITWQHGFLGRIERALAQGEGTRDRGIVVRNRGINGGGVRDLRDGFARSARAGGLPGGDADAPQASFAEVLAADRPAAVVIFIGINDVNWKGTTPEQFTAALTDLVRTAQGVEVRVVLATLLLDRERPDGSNPDDEEIERFARLTREVARAGGAILVDVRQAAIAWLRNHNRRLRLDGTLEFDDVGLLTYDGVHPTDAGNRLLAELLADGLVRALAR